MRFVPGGTSTAWPLIVSLGMRGGRAGLGRGDDPRARAVNQRFELPSELLDVGDVGPDGAVVKGADRRAGAPSRHVQDRVEVVLPPPTLDDPTAHLIDPAGRLAAGRTMSDAVEVGDLSDSYTRLGT